MALTKSSTASGSNEAHANGSNASASKKRISLTRIRRDASVELDDETTASEYSEQSGSSSAEDEPVARPQKRARESTESSEPAPAKQPKYAALRNETRQVEAGVIKNKWKPSTAAAQAKVKTLLSLVERPVINSNRDPERRKEAQASLAALSRIIETRLPRMPFPPETKEWHFDYEAILRSNRDLEQQLAAAKHSSALAQAEIRKEETLLEEAKEELAELERNAKAEQRARTQRERGIPQLWTEPLDAKSDNADRIGLQESDRPAQASLEDEQNFPFIEELEHHISSIENNIEPLAGITEDIDRVSSLLTILSRSAHNE